MAGRHRGEIAKYIAAAKGRVKDPDSARSLEAEMQESVEYLDVNAALAMAAMLLVRTFFPVPAYNSMQRRDVCSSRYTTHTSVV